MNKPKEYKFNLSEHNSVIGKKYIKTELKFKENICKDKLEEAVENTQKSYNILNLKVVEEYSNYKFIPNALPFVIENKPMEEVVKVGGKESNYYPWKITYYDNFISISLLHCICDGRGIFEIIKTLVYYYCKAMGVEVPASEDIITIENQNASEMENPYEKYKDLEISEPIEKDAFENPSLLNREKLKECEDVEFYRICLSSEQFIKKCKELNTSPMPLFLLYLFRSLVPFMESESPVLFGVTVANLRDAFDSKTIRNFVDLPSVQYSATKFEGLSDKEICANIRENVIKFKNRNYILNHIKETNKLYEAVLENKESLAKQKQDFLMKLPTSPIPAPQFFFSYIGKIDFPEVISEHLMDMDFMVASTIVPMLFEVLEYNGKFIMDIDSNMKDDECIKNMVNIFNAEGIYATFEYKGKTHKVEYEELEVNC